MPINNLSSLAKALIATTILLIACNASIPPSGVEIWLDLPFILILNQSTLALFAPLTQAIVPHFKFEAICNP